MDEDLAAPTRRHARMACRPCAGGWLGSKGMGHGLGARRMTMLTVRCSSLDRVMACAGSLVEPAHPYNPNNPEAREGTAGHQALAAVVVGADPDLDAIAAEYDVDRDDLARLVGFGRKAWGQLRQHFPDPRSEVSVEAHLVGCILRGTADVLALSPDALAVLDWKLGWAPTEHTHQLTGYGLAAAKMRGMPTSGRVLCCEVWVRSGEIRVRRYDAEALAAFEAELGKQVELIGRQYGPGLDSCKFCPRQNECPARAEWVRGSVTAIEPLSADTAITRDVVGQIYERTKMLGRALDRYDEVLRSMLAEGPVPLPDGRKLVLEERQQDKIRASKAMPYLREELRLTPDEADEVLKISKGAIERVVKARAAKGKGAAAMREAMAALKNADAIEKVSQRMIKVTAE